MITKEQYEKALKELDETQNYSNIKQKIQNRRTA